MIAGPAPLQVDGALGPERFAGGKAVHVDSQGFMHAYSLSLHGKLRSCSDGDGSIGGCSSTLACQVLLNGRIRV